MSAMFSTTRTALLTGCTKPMPSFMPMSAMCMCMAATAGTLLLGTGVFTSVSLFVLVLLVVSTLLLVSVVVLISLILSSLTGLIGLGSLVGLTIRLVTNATDAVQGD